MTNATFQAGRTYSTTSICDHECVKTLRIGAAYDGAECVKPMGSYSMAPTIRAATWA